MPAIQIPEALDRSLQRAAERLGCAKEELVQEAIAQRLADYDEEPELTESQVERLHHSIDQLNRGEKVGSEWVDIWYAQLSAKLAAR